MLEEGPQLAPTSARGAASGNAAVDARLRPFTTRGTHPFPILRGCCVARQHRDQTGHHRRLPEDVRLDWIARFGSTRWSRKGPRARVRHHRKELDVTETDEKIQGNNARKMAEAAKILGLPGSGDPPQLAQSARARGECLRVAPSRRAKMDVSYIPKSIADGARLHAMCQATKSSSRVVARSGVEGRVLDRNTRKNLGRFVVRARRAVIVAASVIWTPVLLRRSGCRPRRRPPTAPSRLRGGRPLPSRSRGYRPTQAYEIPMRDRGFKIESLTLRPRCSPRVCRGRGPRQKSLPSSITTRSGPAHSHEGARHGAPRVGQHEPTCATRRASGTSAHARGAVAHLSNDVHRRRAEVYPGIAAAAGAAKTSARSISSTRRTSGSPTST